MLLGVDVGGTFTDAVLVDADGHAFTAKVPSTPGEQQVGVMRAVREALARAGAQPSAVRRFAHGMTVATNALLEGRGARTALVATDGFTDVVELARQARPSLYRLCERGPEPLVPPELRFGAPERMSPDGPLRELDEQATERMLARLADADPEAVAVVLLHSYAHPEHEQRLGRLIEERLPAAHLSLSHDLVGTFREYERAATTEIDAALSPLLADYLRRLGSETAREGVPEPQVMQSSGGLTDAARAASHAALTVLSGPAGGVGGALLLSAAAQAPDVLCFDMGGTSCDVCVIDGGRVAETAQRIVAGRAMALGALDIHTVGAGGGSIAWADAGGALRVGPRSAGAEPGPACYGRGAEQPTVTDANLLLGRLIAEMPLAGGVALDRRASERAVGALARELGLEAIECAEGIVRVAETEMLRALRVMTVERGIDPRRFALMPFGGAGPLHACSMARELGIERVLCPRASGVLSALGLAGAAPRRDAAATVMLCGESFAAERMRTEAERLLDRATAQLGGALCRARIGWELRYRGQSFELGVEQEVEVSPGENSASTHNRKPDGVRIDVDPQRLRERFAQAHEERYGYRDEQAEMELVNIRVSVFGEAPALTLAGEAHAPRTGESTETIFDGARLTARLWRGELPPGMEIEAPAVCAMPEATLFVPPGWAGRVDPHGTIVLERRA
ncbi:MAG: hydantoinase/oxoprolinase family protein [Solirubrobacteraceae bacterium]